MSEIDNGGTAFPVELHATTKDCMGFDGDIVKAGHVATYGGMSLRDYFAAKAMQGILANPGGAVQANSACGWSLCNCSFDDVAEFSYQIAEAMLAERNRQK